MCVEGVDVCGVSGCVWREWMCVEGVDVLEGVDVCGGSGCV